MHSPQLSILPLLLLPIADVSCALAYTGGPVRVESVSYVELESRIYFKLRAYDEAYDPPEVYYIELDGTSPRRPIRASTLEQADPLDWSRHPNAEWVELMKHSVPLKPASEFHLVVESTSDSVSVDPNWNVTRYELSVQVGIGETFGTLSVGAVCSPLVRVQGLFEIPGRSERVVVVTYAGRVSGCEQVDALVLIPD